jgi:hypothetical protein
MKTKTFIVNDKQMERFHRWIDKCIGKAKVSEAVEEDASMMSPFKWTFEETGVTCITKVSGFGQTLDLTLDDDGEFLHSFSDDL